jgi:hypothetical protein
MHLWIHISFLLIVFILFIYILRPWTMDMGNHSLLESSFLHPFLREVANDCFSRQTMYCHLMHDLHTSSKHHTLQVLIWHDLYGKCPRAPKMWVKQQERFFAWECKRHLLGFLLSAILQGLSSHHHRRNCSLRGNDLSPCKTLPNSNKKNIKVKFGNTRPPPSLWGFITNSSGLSMAFLMISESSRLHKPAKHFCSLEMSSLFSRNLQR